MGSEAIDRLRRVLDAATPGPWTAGDDPEATPVDPRGLMREEDARALAALGTLHPALLAVVEAAVYAREESWDVDRDDLRDAVVDAEAWQALRDAIDDLDAAIAEALPEDDR